MTLRRIQTVLGLIKAAQQLEVFRLKESRQYRITDSIEDVHIAKRYYSSDYWPSQPTDWIGLKREKTPVFIVGFFRSGSTLLENLLTAAHPAIHGLGETKLLSTYLFEFQEEMTQIANQNTSFSRQQLSVLLQQKSRKYLAAARRRVQELSSLNQLFQQHSQVNISDLLSLSAKKHPTSSTQSQKNLRIINKSLGNYKNIPLIHLLFPEAIIIHLIRDPLDTLLSCLRNRFSDLSPYTIDIETLVMEYISYLEIMAHYREVLPVLDYPTGRRQGLIEICYEEMVANPQQVLNRLLSLLQLPLGEKENNQETASHASLNQSNTIVMKTISFLQVQQPIFNRSVGGWRIYSRQLQQSLIPVLQPHLRRLANQHSLPFDFANCDKRMNWILDPQFDYSNYLRSLRR